MNKKNNSSLLKLKPSNKSKLNSNKITIIT